MGASDLRADLSDRSASARGGATDSLTRTLEDLEARLSRLTKARTEPAVAAAPQGEGVRSSSERLRHVAEQRLSGSSRLALDATKIGDRRGRTSEALERRIGTIAGEVETLKLQGSTLQLVSAIAEDLQSLRAEIADNVAARSDAGFDEIRGAFEDLCERIVETDQSGLISDQIAGVMRRLSEMQAGGLDNRALDALRQELDRVGTLAGLAAREETVAEAARRRDDFEKRLETRIESEDSARRDLHSELQRLRETVRSLATEDQLRAVEKRWEEFEALHFQVLREQAEGGSGEALRTELAALGERIEVLTQAAVAADIDRAEQAAATDGTIEALARLTVRLGELEGALADLPDIIGIDRLEQRIEELADSVALAARERQEPDLEHFLILEERLDEISDAIVSSAVRAEIAFDMGPVERIEARLAELSARVDRMGASAYPAELSAQIATLTSRIEDLAARPSPEAPDEQMSALSTRVEEALRRLEEPHPGMTVFEERLSSLAARLEDVAAAQVDEEVLRSLEGQIARLGAQLAGGTGEGAEHGAEVIARLGAIEERLEQNRAEIMAAARAAADEAVRTALPGGARESEYIKDLSEDLRSLEALCRETDDRSIKVFDAVHSTLVKIAERLTTIEVELREGASADAGAAKPFAEPVVRLPELDALVAGRPFEAPVVPVADGEEEKKGLRAAIARRFAARGANRAAPNAAAMSPVVPELAPAAPVLAERARIEDAPSIEPSDSILFREANRPLEPGSGAPDIASLIDRVRLQQQQRIKGESPDSASKADFIAAARKAALAAAAEAEGLRREDAEAGSEPTAASGERRSGRHRKPILMAVGAVLLAMMAIPLGRVLVPAEPVNSVVETAQTGVELAGEASEPVLAANEAAPATLSQEPASGLTTASTAPAAPVADVRPNADRPSVAELAAARAGAQAPLPTADLVRPTANQPVALPTVDNVSPLARAVRPLEAPVPAPVATTAAIAIDPALSPVLEAAIERLPETARGDLPAAPSGIGPTALVVAADAGDPTAIFEIGLRQMEGRAGQSDIASSFTWFAHAGRLGYAPAQYSLGTLFEKGNGVERDTIAARDWYRLAAEQGNVRAMHNLAVLYATGVDGESDPVEAARWFTAAAEHGMRDSQYNLGILHARGAGVEQDLGQSYKWFSVVAKGGDRDAGEKRDEVAKALTPEQIADLDTQVEAWQPQPRVEAANTVDLPAAWTQGGDQTASVDMSRAVRNVQAILIKLGFDPGTPDGIVGARTTEAVRAFQEQNGLEVTGLIDETLVRELLERNS